MKEDFFAEKLIRRASRDVTLAKALIATADSDLQFLSRVKIDENSARKVMSNYYDVLRSVLEAISALDGYKVYSHEAFVQVLKEKKEEQLAQKFDRFRKIRNSINYYGKSISVEETKENVGEIAGMIAALRARYLKEVK